jgi:hypothetical protein
MSVDERKARNEALFREVNEQIRQVQRELELPDRPMPFICECDDVACRTIVRLTAAEYERIRSDSRRFLVSTGHSTEGRIVEHCDGYVVSEKRGIAGEIAESTDGRRRADGRAKRRIGETDPR